MLAIATRTSGISARFANTASTVEPRKQLAINMFHEFALHRE
nr:hypothetical protein [Candidatus Sigynarchaeota archaeon]